MWRELSVCEVAGYEDVLCDHTWWVVSGVMLLTRLFSGTTTALSDDDSPVPRPRIFPDSICRHRWATYMQARNTWFYDGRYSWWAEPYCSLNPVVCWEGLFVCRCEFDGISLELSRSDSG